MLGHAYLLQEGTEELLSADIRERIRTRKKEVSGEFLETGKWYADEIRREIQRLIATGHYKKDKAPKTHTDRLNLLFSDAPNHPWIVHNGKPAHEEAPYEEDFLLLSGILSAEILTPDEFWNVPEGFSGPSDLHGVIGAMLAENRDRLFDEGGYKWDSVENGRQYRSSISGSDHGDLRIERICTSYSPTIDPFDKPVHYQPVTEREKQLVCAYHSCESTLLAAVLKYIDQEKIDVPCLLDGGKTLLKEAKGKGQHIGNFGDFGQGEDNLDCLMMNAALPMNEAHTERSVFWHLPKEHRGWYRIHIDNKRRLAFTNSKENGTLAAHPSLIFPREEMDHVVRGIITQAQQGQGRTSLRQLEKVLTYRFAPDFEAKMTEQKRKFGVE